MKIKENIIRTGKILRLHVFLYRSFYAVYAILDFIKYRGFSSTTLVSFKEIQDTTAPDVEILYQENLQLSYSPPRFAENTDEKSVLFEGLDYIQYAIHLKNGTLSGSSNLIITSQGKALYDLPSYDTSEKYQSLDTKIISVKNNQVNYWRGRKKYLDKAIWMGGNFSGNYYHLLMEFITKFRKLEKLNIPADVPVLVDEVCLRVPQFKELLEIVNQKGHPLIGVEKTHSCKVEDLYYINCPHFLPAGVISAELVCARDMQFDIPALNDLRIFYLPYFSSRNFPKKIFISRKNATKRRPFNEQQVNDLFREFGFETVYPETLSFREQIALFSQAEYIAGGSGAAFTNLLFCKKDCMAIIFVKAEVPFSIFSSIACVSGVDLRYITAGKTKKNSGKNIREAFFEIDIPYLRGKMMEWIINKY